VKKFKFGLQSVLREREIREDEKKREVAQALLALRKQEKILMDLVNKMRSVESEEIAEKSKKELDIKVIRLCESFLIVLKTKIVTQKKNIQEHENVLVQKQKNLAEAIKRKKIIATLKEKARVNYYQEMEKIEQKLIDEFSVLRFKVNV